MLNFSVLQGNLCNDPELKTTPNGVDVTTVDLAVSRDYKGQDGNRETDFFKIVAWRGTAGFLAKNFKKGQQIIVSGKLQTRKYTTQDGQKRTAFELIADNVYFSGNKEKPNTGASSGSVSDFQEIDDFGDLPF